MPSRSPDEIVRLVDIMESQNQTVRDQMDADFDLYRLTPYTGEDDGGDTSLLAESRKFTSNDPRTNMNLAIHLITTAITRFVVHQPKAQKDERARNNMKELFVIGAFEAANERRARLLTPPVMDAMGAQCGIRGRRVQRVLLIKEDVGVNEDESLEFDRFRELGLGDLIDEPLPSTRTFVDITDWDPRNTYWGMGRHGLGWACHKIMKTRSEIMGEYDLDESDFPDKDFSGSDEGDSRYLSSEEPEFAVYDYFDEENNVVVMEQGIELKSATPHGMGRVPVSIGLVGSLPFFQSDNDNYSAEYGQSLYAADRFMYLQNNFMLSVLSELSARALSPPTVLESRDGSFTLDRDIHSAGDQVSTSTQNEEKVIPVPPIETVKEAGVFLANIQAMMQRGGFPFTAYGELDIALSGVALHSLRQGIEVPIMPMIKSMRIGMKEIGDILADAYATGNFDTMTLSGKLQNPSRMYFEEEITPEQVKDAGNLEVVIEPVLPQDDAAKVQLAALATQGEIPMVDMRFARENYLGLQDVDQIERAVFEQLSQTASPLALSMKMMNSAAEQGDMELAQVYFLEFQGQMMQKLMDLGLIRNAFSQQQGGSGQPSVSLNGNGGSSRQPMLSPDVNPPANAGVPPPRPVPQAGPNVPPGTPRPGAQQEPTDPLLL